MMETSTLEYLAVMAVFAYLFYYIFLISFSFIGFSVKHIFPPQEDMDEEDDIAMAEMVRSRTTEEYASCPTNLYKNVYSVI